MLHDGLSDEVAEITDFDENRDALIYYYPNGTPEPDVVVSEDDDGTAIVLADGAVIATLTGADVFEVQIMLIESRWS